MLMLTKGRYTVRLGQSAGDVRRAQALRYAAFIGGPQPPGPDAPLDRDDFDAACHHLLVEEGDGGALVSCCRLLPLSDGGEIGQSYSAQFYDPAGLREFGGRMLEVGRFCIDPQRRSDPDIIRLAWAALARLVDDWKIELLFGCSSFPGTEPAPYRDAFAVLRERHLAPTRWRPRRKSARALPFPARPGARNPDRVHAMSRIPALLRSYLALGGWVSDHAVIDPALNTLHVFTGLEIGAIPPARARLLRAAAG